jgi:aldehyde:ferredoxin oxidoreductase
LVTHGWIGKFLRVDLTKNETKIDSSTSIIKEFVGGRGVGQWILFTHLHPEIPPLHPENLLIVSTGPLTGTMAPASCRTSIDTKNLYTGGVLSSNCGGHIGPELKFAGFDFIIIGGSSKSPKYILIKDGHAEIRDAKHLWEKNTWETENILRKDLADNNLRVASIGIAGENMAKPACIIADRGRAAGRGGVGAIMGSKKLKAIAIRGTGGVNLAEPERFMSEVNRVWDKIDQNKSTEIRRAFGTRAFLSTSNELGFLGVRNFQDDFLSLEKIEKVKQDLLNKKYEIRKLACFNCPIYCSHLYRIDYGDNQSLYSEGFQLNIDWDFTGKLDIDDPEALIRINALCTELGLDIDNSSAPISWAFELFEKGIIGTDDTDGLRLEWGNTEVVVELLNKIAKKEGFGKILAEGSKRASEIIGNGSENYVSHIKGQDSIEAMRSDLGWALGCSTAARGGGHLDGAFQSHRTPGAGDPTSPNSKAERVFWFERFKAIIDMLGICYFATVWSNSDLLGAEDVSSLFSKATGVSLSASELMLIGQRVRNVEKAFNTIHAGFVRSDDYPPARFMQEPIRSGPKKDCIIGKAAYDKMLDEYYDLHGWDVKTGWQTAGNLDKLNLTEVKEKLQNNGRLINGK